MRAETLAAAARTLSVPLLRGTLAAEMPARTIVGHSVDLRSVLSYLFRVKKTLAKTLIPALCTVVFIMTAFLCGFVPSAAAEEAFAVYAEDGTVFWRPVPEAVRYDVTVTDSSGGTVRELSFAADTLFVGFSSLFRGGGVYTVSVTVFWRPVPEAVRYDVTVTDSSGGTVRELSFAADTLFVGFSSLFRGGGVYTVSVTAFADAASIASASVTVEYRTVLAPPSDGAFEDGILCWTAVYGAKSYSLTVNGIFVGTYSEPAADIGGLLLLSGEYTCSVTAEGDEYNAASSPYVFTVTNTVPPLPPHDAVVSPAGGGFVASWTPTAGDAPDHYVYTLISDGEVLVCAETTANRADISAYVTDGEFVLTVTAVKDGRAGAPLTAAFAVQDGRVVYV